MKHPRLNQKGFTAVEGLLIIVILAVVGGTGYFVYHANKNANDTLSSATKVSQGSPDFKKKTTTKTAPTSLVTLKSNGAALATMQLPANWSSVPISGDSQVSCSVTATNSLTPLDKGEAVPTKAVNDPNNTVIVDYDIVKQPDSKSLQDYFTDDLYGGYDSGIHTFKDYVVNGNPAVLYNGSGKPDGSDYKQQYYLISHNGYVACLRWRYFDAGNTAAANPAAYDNSAYLNAVQAFANSTKFN